MRRKTLFTLFVTAFTVFSMVGFAMAANTVTVTSDKPIQPKSECSLAGSQSWNMDNETTLHEGDIVRYLLPTDVTICGTINYFLRLYQPGIAYDISSVPGSPIIATAAGSTFDVQSAGASVAPGALVDANGALAELGFKVTGTDNARTYQMQLGTRSLADIDIDTTGDTVLDTTVPAGTFMAVADDGRDITVTFNGAAATTLLVVKFFSGNIDPLWFLERDNVSDFPNVYDVVLDDVSDNTICLDNLEYNSSTIAAIPESRPYQPAYQLNFLGDFIIQQLISAVGYTVEPACKDDVCQLVPLSLDVTQSGQEVEADGEFDFGDYLATVPASPNDSWTSDGYCTSPTIGNGIIFKQDGQDFQAGDEYRVTMTVRAGTTADVERAIFRDGAIGTRHAFTDANNSENCEFRVDGQDWLAAGWALYGGPDNDDATAIRATINVTTDEEDADAILFDLPYFKVFTEEVSAGEKVFIDVVIEKLPCGGAIVQETICLAELIDFCPTPAGAAMIDGIAFIGDRSLTSVLHGYLGRTYVVAADNSLFFPYAPALEDAGFFTGFGLTNVGDTDVNLTFTVTDASGGMATYTPADALPAGNMWVNTLDAIADELVDGATPLDMTLPVNVNIEAAPVVP